MRVHDILAKPIWQRFAHLPGFASLSAAAIEVADDFFAFVVAHGLAAPTAGDIREWLTDIPEDERGRSLDCLDQVFDICQPAFLRTIADARIWQPTKPVTASVTTDVDRARRPIHETREWDPVAAPTKKPPKPRQISVQPSQLPHAFQCELRRAADGLPGREAGMRVPARSIVKRMREKLCQYVWSANKRGLAAELSRVGIEVYLADVIRRSSAKKHGLRWATVRASADGLYVFSRYSGASDEIQAVLRAHFREFEMRENAQRALKFFALARTGNTTDKILDLAEHLLVGVDAELRPRKRHQMRNGAAILAIFANAPLRNASAQLVFGVTLFWEHDEWVIRMRIQKTHVSRPEPFEYPLNPEYGRFIDAVILGDASPAMLPKMRERVLAEQRQLFCLPDGTPAAASYVPRVFRALTGNSFTTLRVMLYSDAVSHHGLEGIELAMPSANHASTDIVRQHYICELVAGVHARNLRTKRESRNHEKSGRFGSLMAAIDEDHRTCKS